MKRVPLLFLVCVVMMVLGNAAAAAGRTQKDSKPASLYQRLGGSEMLGKIFDDVGPRMAADPLLAQFFQGQSTEALERQRQRTIDFLCHETGGPCKYTGQPVKKAHLALNISKGQFEAFLKHLGESLDSLKVGDKEKREMLALAARFQSDVVSKK